jgi:HD-GYP domain-containing protein (c-di-GMP phosphodiesterase class II)
MNLSAKELEIIKYAGLLHDIGKVGIKDDVLLKCGSFTPAEKAEMETHTIKTRDILENFRFSKTLAQVPFVAAHHHEWFDGEGYPDGLMGEDIPLGSRILAVADVFDALTSLRDYPKYTSAETMGLSCMPLNEVLDTINSGAGTQFDARVVAAFLPCIEDALLKYRGTHFSSNYVTEAIERLHHS